MCERCSGALPGGYQKSWEQAIRGCPRLQTLGQPTIDWLITALRNERRSAEFEAGLGDDEWAVNPYEPGRQATDLGDQERPEPGDKQAHPSVPRVDFQKDPLASIVLWGVLFLASALGTVSVGLTIADMVSAHLHWSEIVCVGAILVYWILGGAFFDLPRRIPWLGRLGGTTTGDGNSEVRAVRTTWSYSSKD